MIRAAVIGLSLLAQSAAAQGMSAARILDSCGGTRVTVGGPDGLDAARLDQAQDAIGTRLQAEFSAWFDYTTVKGAEIIVSIPDGIGDPAIVYRQLDPFAFGLHAVVERGAFDDLVASGGEIVLPAANEPGMGYILAADPILDANAVIDSQPMLDQGNAPAVTFRFSDEGTAVFAAYTAQNIGLPIAIVINRDVISAPVIREPILGGSGIISGSYSVDESQRLAQMLRGGPLAEGFRVIAEQSVDGSDPSADFCP